MASWLTHLRHTLRAFLGVRPTLDLHGCSVREGLALTEAFLRHAQEEGDPVVRIIYGKGRGSPGGVGVLRQLVPRWLEHEGATLVERYQRLPDSSGDDGAVLVWIKPAAAR